MGDIVNHPHHYNRGKECIEIIKDFLTPEAFEGYVTGNALKYIYRWKDKGGVEDLKKAIWYINYLSLTNSPMTDGEAEQEQGYGHSQIED